MAKQTLVHRAVENFLGMKNPEIQNYDFLKEEYDKYFINLRLAFLPHVKERGHPEIIIEMLNRHANVNPGHPLGIGCVLFEFRCFLEEETFDRIVSDFD